VISTINKTYQSLQKASPVPNSLFINNLPKINDFDFSSATHHGSSEWFFITFRKKSLRLIAKFSFA